MNKVAPISKDFDALGETIQRAVDTINRKPVPTSSEAIADQAVAIISRASAHVSEELDGLQKRLDQLRAAQHDKLIAAQDAIRDLMNWSQYVSECSGAIDAEITKIRGDSARPI